MFLMRKLVKATKKPEKMMMEIMTLMALRPITRKVSTGASDVRVYPTPPLPGSRPQRPCGPRGG